MPSHASRCSLKGEILGSVGSSGFGLGTRVLRQTKASDLIILRECVHCPSLCLKAAPRGCSRQAENEQEQHETKTDLTDSELSLFPYFLNCLPRLQIKVCI